jgi:hypothetical protein
MVLSVLWTAGVGFLVWNNWPPDPAPLVSITDENGNTVTIDLSGLPAQRDLGAERRTLIVTSTVLWIAVPMAVYIGGLTIRWVYRCFRGGSS